MYWTGLGSFFLAFMAFLFGEVLVLDAYEPYHSLGVGVIVGAIALAVVAGWLAWRMKRWRWGLVLGVAGAIALGLLNPHDQGLWLFWGAAFGALALGEWHHRAWDRLFDPEAIAQRLAAMPAAERSLSKEIRDALRKIVRDITKNPAGVDFAMLAFEALGDVPASAKLLEALHEEDWAAVATHMSLAITDDMANAVAVRIRPRDVEPTYLWALVRSPIELYDRDSIIVWDRAKTAPPVEWELLFGAPPVEGA